jgi:dTDP-4-dehydrorhamnose 3,5-epimerase-like enzyme
VTSHASLDETAYLVDLPSNRDNRGVLTSVEQINNIPIEIRRVFYMHHMVKDRGGHSHIDTDQVVIAAHGSMFIKLTFPDTSTCEYTMDDPCKGLYIPRLTFIEIGNITQDAVCLVLANTFYDMSMSLRNIEQYLDYIKNQYNVENSQ